MVQVSLKLIYVHMSWFWGKYRVYRRIKFKGHAEMTWRQNSSGSLRLAELMCRIQLDALFMRN